jgi:hypothetical protein
MVAIMKHFIPFVLAAFVAIGFAACSLPVTYYPATQFKLKPKADKTNKSIKVSGTAVRLEDDGWKLSLIFDTLGESGVQDASIINESYPLALGKEDGKFVVAWEVPIERWKDKKPFVLSLALNDSNKNNPLITVKHPIRDIEFNALGQVVRVVLTIGCVVVLIVAPGVFLFI